MANSTANEGEQLLPNHTSGFLWFLLIIFSFFLFPSLALAKYSGGAGNVDNPYRIETAEDLNDIGSHTEDWGARFVLTADINLSGYTGEQFNIIGNGSQSFTGYFDGNDHTIRNFSYNSTGSNYIGVFGRTGAVFEDAGQIRNLTLDNFDVNAGSGRFVGTLVGHARGSVINCRVTNSIVRGTEEVGGLVGSFAYSVLADCSADCNIVADGYTGGLTGYCGGQAMMIQCWAAGRVTGREYVGGLVGRNSGQIFRCYASADVTGLEGGYDTGGLVGLADPDSLVQDSFARGDVEGGMYVGGFLGTNWLASVINCYSVGSVSGVTFVGGFIGNNNSPGSNVACFWDNQSSGQSFGVGAGSADGIFGKSTEQMMTQTTFTDAGWDFNSPVWTIDEGIDYPTLVAQEYIHDYGGGTGTTIDPFLIYTAEQMQQIGLNEHHWDLHFKLMNDIDLGLYDGREGRARFNKIGYYNSSSDYRAFSGTFDGNDHTISGFDYNAPVEDFVGLFGYVDGPNAVIKNLGLISPSVFVSQGFQQTGSLVGLFKYGSLENCYALDVNITGDYMVGGLIGRLREAEMFNCWTSGVVTGVEEVGGLVGENDKGEIHYCRASVSVTASSYSSGGLIGESSCGLVNRCSADGDVNGSDIVGGLIGTSPLVYSEGVTCTGDIIDCWAAGNVTGAMTVGGLAGSSFGSTIGCYALGDVNGTYYVGGLVGNAGIVSECYATGDVTGGDIVGGLTGTNGIVMSDSFARGNVSGGYTVGGLTGANYTTLQHCYSVGSVSGLGSVGALIGHNDEDGDVVNSFWDKQSSGISVMCGSSYGAGCDNSFGRTTAEMKTKATFNSAGWDFVGETLNGPNDVWGICEATNYPKLVSYIPLPGDFTCPDRVDMKDFAKLAQQWGFGPLTQDYYPDPGDGIVNLFDFAVFAQSWALSYDARDLADFTTEWLMACPTYADIAPLPVSDNVVDFLDLAALADDWLKEY